MAGHADDNDNNTDNARRVKQCPKCGEFKPEAEGFYRLKKGAKPDCWCKQCRRLASLAAYRANSDAINEGGSAERRVPGSKGWLYGRVRRQGYPRDKYRVLCFNCNAAWGLLGNCPRHRPQQAAGNEAGDGD